MKKFLLIILIALSTFSTATSARVGGGPISQGPVGPVYVNRYWGKFGYESANGQYQYIKIVGGNTLASCQTAYWTAYYSYVSSPTWNVTGHLLLCTSH